MEKRTITINDQFQAALGAPVGESYVGFWDLTFTATAEDERHHHWQDFRGTGHYKTKIKRDNGESRNDEDVDGTVQCADGAIHLCYSFEISAWDISTIRQAAGLRSGTQASVSTDEREEFLTRPGFEIEPAIS